MDEHCVDQVLDEHSSFCGRSCLPHWVDVERSEQCRDFIESVEQLATSASGLAARLSAQGAVLFSKTLNELVVE
jgi:hypothetical protein